MSKHLCPYCHLTLVDTITNPDKECNGNLYLAPNPYDVAVNNDSKPKRQCDGYRAFSAHDIPEE